ncbi:hypothetical protein [Streptomyces agglomeratus]|nr:hypothetical protein [Streptomyces agglomeratus]
MAHADPTVDAQVEAEQPGNLRGRESGMSVGHADDFVHRQGLLEH